MIHFHVHLVNRLNVEFIIVKGQQNFDDQNANMQPEMFFQVKVI